MDDWHMQGRDGVGGTWENGVNCFMGDPFKRLGRVIGGALNLVVRG